MAFKIYDERKISSFGHKQHLKPIFINIFYSLQTADLYSPWGLCGLLIFFHLSGKELRENADG